MQIFPSFHKLSRTVNQSNEERDMNTIILVFAGPSTCLKYVYRILLCYSKNNTDAPILITKKRPRSIFQNTVNNVILPKSLIYKNNDVIAQKIRKYH